MPDYRKATRRAAARHGVDPDLLEAQIGQESGFKMGLVSKAGARDIAQFMPGTAKSMGVMLGDGRARDDLDGAARLMRRLLDKYKGDRRSALAAYNAGEGNVDKYGGVPPFAETQHYVKTILGAAGPGSGRTPKRTSGGGVAPPSTSTTRTVPGVDRSEERRALLLDYLQERGKPAALLALKGGLDEAQDTPARTERVRTPGKTRTEPTRAATGGQGGVKGLIGQVQTVDRWAAGLGVPVTAKQEHGHAPGGDHDPAVKKASARDYGGDEHTREQLFRKVARRLGVPNAKYKGPDINVVVDGIRWQVISRDHGSGPHLHVGWRVVDR